jgi:transposase
MIQGLQTGGSMGRKPRVEQTPEEKWQIIQEGMKSGNVSETCRRHEIAQTLFYRWKDEAEQGAKAALGGKSAAAAETEKDRRIRQLERSLGRKSLEIEILKNVVGE